MAGNFTAAFDQHSTTQIFSDHNDKNRAKQQNLTCEEQENKFNFCLKNDLNG